MSAALNVPLDMVLQIGRIVLNVAAMVAVVAVFIVTRRRINRLTLAVAVAEVAFEQNARIFRAKGDHELAASNFRMATDMQGFRLGRRVKQ